MMESLVVMAMTVMILTGNILLWYPHFLFICFHPTFRIGGPMEYVRSRRVERSVEMGMGQLKNKTKQNKIETSSFMAVHACVDSVNV